MSHERTDLIERITDITLRRINVIQAMYRRFPPFPFERDRYNFLRARKAILEHGLAHLGGKLHAANGHD